MINIFHLKCFRDAAMMGNLSEAARRNFVSQPAVSKAIRGLEMVLGVSLCHHKKQHFELTPEGEIVFFKCKEIFSSINNLQDALDQYKKQPTMPLHFVATQSMALSLFPDLIPPFKKKHPGIDLYFLTGGLSQIKGWLKQGIAEFAIVIDSCDVDEFDRVPLYKGRFMLYTQLHSNVGLGRHQSLSIEKMPIYVEHKKGFLVAEYAKKSKMDLTNAVELNSWELIARTLEKHGGSALLPDIMTLRYSQLVPDSPISLPYTVCAIVPKGHTLSLSANAFLELLASCLEKGSKGGIVANRIE